MRLRIRYSKHGKIRFTSHRDVARIWERTLRRSGLPVAYSQGFSPRPRLSFGLALSTGYESDAEYLDVELDPQASAQPAGIDLESGLLTERLSQALPDGMTASAACRIDRAEPSLQQAVTSCTWQIDVADVVAETAARAVAQALAADELLVNRERKGRMARHDIRPALLAVDVEDRATDGVRLIAELGMSPRAVHPRELLAALDPPPRELRVRRLQQWIATDGAERREPLAAAALSVAGRGVSP